jgi:hypothetical protein
MIKAFTDGAVIRPKNGRQKPIDPRDRVRVETSIEVYALTRVGLVEERQQVLRLIQQRISTIDQLARILDNTKIAERVQTLIEDLITHEMVELSRVHRADRPYSLMARQVIDAYFRAPSPRSHPNVTTRCALPCRPLSARGTSRFWCYQYVGTPRSFERLDNFRSNVAMAS